MRAANADGISPTDADSRNRTGGTAERDGRVLIDPEAAFVIESGDERIVAGIDENSGRFQSAFV